MKLFGIICNSQTVSRALEFDFVILSFNHENIPNLTFYIQNVTFILHWKEIADQAYVACPINVVCFALRMTTRCAIPLNQTSNGNLTVFIYFYPVNIFMSVFFMDKELICRYLYTIGCNIHANVPMSYQYIAVM